MNKKQIKNRNKLISEIIDDTIKTSCSNCTIGGCCRNITSPDVVLEEWDILKNLVTEDILKRAKIEIVKHDLTGRSTCPFLDEDNRCSVYLYRPFTCASHYVISPIEYCDTINNPTAITQTLNKIEIFKVLTTNGVKIFDNANHSTIIELFRDIV